MPRVEELREAFLARAGFGDELVRTVDADDEMLNFVRRRAKRPDHEQFHYFQNGAEALGLLRHVQRTLGRPLADLDAVLDFASGWGRVTRFLAAAAGSERVFVSDIAAGSIRFCTESFGVRSFPSALDPQAVEAPRSFDLIFVGSLFTHLPRSRFGAWLERLLAMLSPGGSLVFTTHAPDRLRPEDRDPSGFTYRESSPIDYLPVSEYASTYVAVDLVHELAAAAGAGQVETIERGLWYYHDVHVARREPAEPLRGLARSPSCYGRLERAEEVRPGHGWVGGFVCAPTAHGPLRSVELWIDGRHVGPFGNLSTGEALDPLGEARPDWRRHEFYDEGDISGLGTGEHVVAAVAQQEHGPPQCFDVLPLRTGS